MKKYLSKDVLTPAGVLVFLIAYVFEAMQNSAPIVNGVPQESFFPLIIFIAGAIADLFLLVSAFKNAKETEAVAEEKNPRNLKALYVVIAAAAFIFLFDLLGFMIVAPIFVFAMMLIYDDRPQQIPKKILFTILITAVIYVLYTQVFDINFPEIWR
ncbi:MAG: tripartite tricarboxylate transporter TctB family protein [Lachnospiraceae bacterium]|nr:tripartite tricarboxylate transporter TctB family protein [Lachnospiraceae bacterium]